uniref:SNW domain-containing protein 1 n=1 Tax=Nomascus leucogenys TaxID=61853 RepID=A0A2I3GZI9_NOMLE
ASLLTPAPTQLSQDQLEAEEKTRSQRSWQTSFVSSGKEPSPYGYRKGWTLRLLEDFGDGGAFPEIHVAQYPLDMGRKKKISNELAIKVDSEGKIKYDVITRQGQSKDKVIDSKYTVLVPEDVMNANDPDSQRPDEEAIKEITEKTRANVAVVMPVQAADKPAPKVSRMVEVQKDPTEPLRFKINKKIPRGPPSPPVPVMHSPSRKMIFPPCISNWKNAKKACEAVEMRPRVERKMAQKEKGKYEEKLREMAQKAKDRRAGIKTHVDRKDREARERNEIWHDRRKERQHDQNLSRAAPDKRSKLQRNENGGISEVIALGQYDQRLLNQSKGMDSGFAGGEDEIYNRGGKDMAHSIYRPSKNLDKDMYDDDLEARIKINRSVPDNEFSGSGCKQRGREGPVQFEEDPFGLGKFLEEAKQHGGSKRPSDSSCLMEYEHEGKKRRKD